MALSFFPLVRTKDFGSHQRVTPFSKPVLPFLTRFPRSEIHIRECLSFHFESCRFFATTVFDPIALN